MKNIILVGFMGTGKTSVGRLLAKRLNKDFIEIDTLIEETSGMKIRDIFEKKGEESFRSIEKEIIKKACMNEDSVISAGGGAIIDEENYSIMKKNCIIICLEASPDTILKRTYHTKDRPLLNVSDPLSKIKELLDKRLPYYRRSDFNINTDGLSIEEVTSRIEDLIR